MMAKGLEQVCFLIAPIGEEKSDVRDHSDKTLRDIVRPAATKLKLKAMRADNISRPGMITLQVIDYIVNCAVCVADLTGLNPNVMYELAIRHATGRPVIQICHKNDRLPFDIKDFRTIFFDIDKPDDVAEAFSQLVKQLRCCIETPQQYRAPFRDLKCIDDLAQDCLDDAKTRNLIRLHTGCASHYIYYKIDSILTQMERDPHSYNSEHFRQSVLAALYDSRQLCNGFRSRALGDVYTWFETNNPKDELEQLAREGQETILERTDLDPNLKRIQLLQYIETIMSNVRQRIEHAILNKVL